MPFDSFAAVASKDYVDRVLEERESVQNKTLAISSVSTDVQYPSAKAVYDIISAIDASKQDKITATGANNLLTAPAAAGGQPGTIAQDNFVNTSDDQTIGGVKTFSSAPIVPAQPLP